MDRINVEWKGKNRTAAGDGDLRVAVDLAEFLERERGGGAV